MKPTTDFEVIAGLAVFVVIIAAVLCLPFFGWYKAGLQADVYRREGIEISQWEVFVGVKPARAVPVEVTK